MTISVDDDYVDLLCLLRASWPEVVSRTLVRDTTAASELMSKLAMTRAIGGTLLDDIVGQGKHVLHKFDPVTL